jgi:hypothetical protein
MQAGGAFTLPWRGLKHAAYRKPCHGMHGAAYDGRMKIIGTLETITTAAASVVNAVSVLEETVVEADQCVQGLGAVERNLPEGTRLTGIHVER